MIERDGYNVIEVDYHQSFTVDTGFSLSLKNARLGPFFTLMSPEHSS